MLARHSHVAWVALLAACHAPTLDVSIPFASTASGAPFGCGAPAVPLGDPPTPGELQYLSLYVSDVVVVAGGTEFPVTPVADGEYQDDEVSLVDLGDGTGGCLDSAGHHDTFTGTVDTDAEGWDGLRFSVGVPDDRDHLDLDTAEPPLADPNLWWSWSLGYKFMRYEIAGGTADEWQMHLGSGECTGSDDGGWHCAVPNRPRVELDDFSDGDTVAIDAPAMLAGSDLGSGGCFSDSAAACAAPLAALGLPYDGGPVGSGQTVFARD